MKGDMTMDSLLYLGLAVVCRGASVWCVLLKRDSSPGLQCLRWS